MNTRHKSEAMASVHEAITDLHGIGLMDSRTAPSLSFAWITDHYL